MFLRIATAALLLASSTPLAAAQSTTGTSMTTAPAKSAPSAGIPKSGPQIPSAPRSGEKGLATGEGSQTGDIQIKQKR